MKLPTLLDRIRKMKDRAALSQIIHTAEARASKLCNIESERERARLWIKVEDLGIKKGDIVYIHTPLPVNAKGERLHAGSTHESLWAKPLEVREVKPRSKEIVVRVPGRTKLMTDLDHALSPNQCEKLKLSKEPTAAALARGLGMERHANPDSLRKSWVPAEHLFAQPGSNIHPKRKR